MDKDLGLLLLIILILLVLSKRTNLETNLENTGAAISSNEEVMEWDDYRGKHYKISIHREVHENG